MLSQQISLSVMYVRPKNGNNEEQQSCMLGQKIAKKQQQQKRLYQSCM